MADIFARGSEEKKNYVGTMVVYTHVGSLPPDRVEKFMSKFKQEIKQWVDICENQGYCVLFMPTRTGETCIEKLDFTPKLQEKELPKFCSPLYDGMGGYDKVMKVDFGQIPEIKLTSVDQPYIYDKIQDIGNITFPHVEVNKQESYTKMKIAEDVATLRSWSEEDFSLDCVYTPIFKSNEFTSYNDGKTSKSVYAPLECTPICPGTLAGTVYQGLTPVQTFVVNEKGEFYFCDIGRPEAKGLAKGSSIDWNCGELQIKWNKKPGKNHCVISYEYNPECGAKY